MSLETRLSAIVDHLVRGRLLDRKVLGMSIACRQTNSNADAAFCEGGGSLHALLLQSL